MLAVAGGVLLALTADFKLLDLGFLEALNRPFDPLIDWTYTGSLVETVRDSVGEGLGVRLGRGGLVMAALLVLLPLALVRVTGGLSGIVVVRGSTGRDGIAMVRRGHARSPGRQPARRVPGRRPVRVGSGDPHPGEIRAQPGSYRQRRRTLTDRPDRTCWPACAARTSSSSSWRATAASQSRTRPISRGQRGPRLGDRDLSADGFSARSAYLTSPTFGAVSWLAHATLQTGLWVDNQQRYDTVVTSPRLALSRLFSRAGWRTVADIPANNRDWPQGAFYGYDRVYDSRNVGSRDHASAIRRCGTSTPWTPSSLAHRQHAAR